MVLEWLRRRDPALDAQLRKFLFTTDPITEIGGATEGGGDPGTAEGLPTVVSGSLGIGSLKSMER